METSLLLGLSRLVPLRKIFGEIAAERLGDAEGAKGGIGVLQLTAQCRAIGSLPSSSGVQPSSTWPEIASSE